jgi:hypothetical protein
MRKIKIFFTTLAVAGVLFATNSCVDNTESESVSALRNAKAAELTAQAQNLKDLAAIQKVKADAEAALNTAKAATEVSLAAINQAEAALRTAQADAALLKAESDKLYAEADKLRAEGEKALNEGQAKHFEAQAKQAEADAKHTEALALDLILKARADSATAVETLRETKYQNDLLLAGLEDQIKKAELEAKQLLAEQQILYVQAAGNLNAEVALRYAALVVQVKDEYDNILELQNDILEKDLQIAKYQSDLVKAAIDKEAFIKQYEVTLNSNIAKINLDLKQANYDLAYTELKNDADIKKYFEDLKEVIKNDSIAYIANLKDAEDALEIAIADTAAKLQAIEDVKSEIFDAAKSTYEEAKESYEAAWQTAVTAEETLRKYIEASSSLTYDGEWVSLPDYFGETVDGYPLTYTYEGTTYNREQLQLTYKNTSYTRYELNDFPNVRVLLTVSNSGYYYWEIYKYKPTPVDDGDIYPTKQVLENDIRDLKYNMSTEQVEYDKARVTLSKATDSVTIWGDSVYIYKTVKLTKAQQDVTNAENVLETALSAYNNAKIPFEKYASNNLVNPRPSQADTTNLKNKSRAYNWKGWPVSATIDDWTNPTELEGYHDDDDKSAEYLLALEYDTLIAVNLRLNAVNIKYSDFKVAVRYATQSVIGNYSDSITSSENLAKLENLLVALSSGTREKLEFAKDKANEIAIELSTDFYNKLESYKTAQDTLNKVNAAFNSAKWDYGMAIDAVNNAQYLYDANIEGYNDLVNKYEFELSLGGELIMLQNQEDNLTYKRNHISELEKQLAIYQLYLENLIEYNGDIEYAINNYNNLIKELENGKVDDLREIEKSEQKQKIYQNALDTFLKEYESLSE